jgi:hypothetical protein
MKSIFNQPKGKWPDELIKVVWNHSINFSRSTGFTPFKLLFGDEAIVGAKANTLPFAPLLRILRCSNEGCIHNTPEQAKGTTRMETGAIPFALVSQTKAPLGVDGLSASTPSRKAHM